MPVSIISLTLKASDTRNSDPMLYIDRTLSASTARGYFSMARYWTQPIRVSSTMFFFLRSILIIC